MSQPGRRLQNHGGHWHALCAKCDPANVPPAHNPNTICRGGCDRCDVFVSDKFAADKAAFDYNYGTHWDCGLRVNLLRHVCSGDPTSAAIAAVVTMIATATK